MNTSTASQRRFKTLEVDVILFTLVTLTAGCFRSLQEVPLSFILEFPATADLGELWLVEDVNCFTCGNGEKNLGRATGKHAVQLPAAHWYVSLRMPQNAASLLPHLQHPSLMNIGDLNLSGSDVKDDNLKHIASINLRSINLSKTHITGEGLKYLKPHKRWIFVNLEHCDELNPDYLSHFKGWTHSTIRLVSYKWSGDTYADNELKLLDRAKQAICDNQPEDVCGTQIR